MYIHWNVVQPLKKEGNTDIFYNLDGIILSEIILDRERQVHYAII